MLLIDNEYILLILPAILAIAKEGFGTGFNKVSKALITKIIKPKKPTKGINKLAKELQKLFISAIT